MKSRTRLKNFLSCLAIAGVAVIGLATIGQRVADAQSLTLSFAFDQGAATSTSAPITSQTITSANSGQTYLIDVFATVTGTSGNTNLANLGINNMLFRGYSSSVNNGAFTTSGTGSVGVQNDGNLQSTSNNNIASVPTSISDGGSTNGTTSFDNADG